MFFHIHPIPVGVEMGVFQRVYPAPVAENLLSDVGVCDLCQVGGGRMSKQPGMELFINTDLIRSGPEDILQSSRRDPLFTDG